MKLLLIIGLSFTFVTLMKSTLFASSALKSNRLSTSQSPYLKEHENDPIWWQPWGEDAIKAAKKENKLIFLSIGYSTCYWCHFMHKDSFEKQDVADLLNANFISIKVDREEHPDVDKIYMTALTAMQGAGGWPISMFLTPDLKPVYGQSTIRHDDFVSILAQLSDIWSQTPEKLSASADQISGLLPPYLNHGLAKKELNQKVLAQFFHDAVKNYDTQNGGFNPGTKFPDAGAIRLLLRIHKRSGVDAPLKMATRTLDKMALGSIFDHVGGGFHRYTVDPAWKLPHFEKMLYTNAELAIAYTEAYQLTQNPTYKYIAQSTLDWAIRDMQHPDGGFFSAIDAGQVDKEGEYYVWTQSELESILSPDEFDTATDIFDIRPDGNFEHGQNILYIEEKDHYPLPGQTPAFKTILDKLRTARSQKTMPHIDTKIITDQNGLMIGAMAKAYSVFGNRDYLTAAQTAATFIQNRLTGPNGDLRRYYNQRTAQKRAILDDYAFLIHGLIELYQADFNPKWLDWALQLQDRQNTLFWDPKKSGYFYDDGQDQSLIVRAKVWVDQAQPSGNGLSMLNLLRLHALTTQPEPNQKAITGLQTAFIPMSTAPMGYTYSLMALDFLTDHQEIVITGTDDEPEPHTFKSALQAQFLPNAVFAGTYNAAHADGIGILDHRPANQSLIYVCRNGQCDLPTDTVKTALKQIQKTRRLEL